MRETKNLAATMNWEIMRSPHWTSISEDGSTGGLNWQLAVYTMHRIVPDSFLCVFSNMFCLFVVMQYILVGWLGAKVGKKTDAKGRR